MGGTPGDEGGREFLTAAAERLDQEGLRGGCQR